MVAPPKITIITSPAFAAPQAAAALTVAAPLAAASPAAALAAPLWAPAASVDVRVGVLKKNFQQTLSALGDVFRAAEEKTFGGMQLNEVEVSLEVSGDGKVGILGMGASMSGTTGLKLTFKRS